MVKCHFCFCIETGFIARVQKLSLEEDITFAVIKVHNYCNYCDVVRFTLSECRKHEPFKIW